MFSKHLKRFALETTYATPFKASNMLELGRTKHKGHAEDPVELGKKESQAGLLRGHRKHLVLHALAGVSIRTSTRTEIGA